MSAYPEKWSVWRRVAGRCLAWTLGLFVLACVPQAAADDRISGSLQLTYRIAEIRSGNEERIDSQFMRLYKMGLSKDFTPTVNFSGSFDLSEFENNEYRTTSQIPELRLTVCSDVVDANIGYRMVEKGLRGLTTSSDEDRRTTESWNLDVAVSAPERTRARMSYRQDRNYDYLEVREADTQQDDWFWSIDHELLDPLSVGYSLRLKESVDKAAEVRKESEMNEGRLRFADNYLDGTLSASGSYTHTVNETETIVGGKTYVIETLAIPSAGLGQDSTPGVGIALDPLPLLIDGDLTTSTGRNIGGAGNTDRNLGLDLGRAVKVDELRLYTSDATFTPGSFTWELYSSDDGILWAQISASAGFTYDDELNYFAITVPAVEKRYLKVVNVSNDATVSPIYVTELEAYALGTRASGSKAENISVNKNAQWGMGYRPIDWLWLNYDLSQTRRQEAEDAEEIRRDTHNIGSRVTHAIGPYVTGTGQFQRRLESQTGEMNRTSESYLANLQAQPLDTLDADLSLNRVDTHEGPDPVSRNSVAQMYVGAQVREGASLGLEGGLSTSENYQAGSVTTAKTLGTNVNLELTRSLTADLTHDIRWTETEQAMVITEGHTSFSKLSMSLRPSREVNLRGSYSLDRDYVTDVETTRQECSLGWLLTRKLQLNASWSLERSEFEKKAFNTDLAWTLSQVLNLRFGYDWSWYRSDILTEVHQYSMSLTAKF